LDPTGHDTLYRWLAYGHPAWMLIAIAMAVLALRALASLGSRAPQMPALATRSSARSPSRSSCSASSPDRSPCGSCAAARPTRRPTPSSPPLRGRAPYETAHAFLATFAAALFASVAILGRRLERGSGRSRSRRMVDAHAALALLGTLAAAVAFATGFVLLP
jgi:hypothetical protein